MKQYPAQTVGMVALIAGVSFAWNLVSNLLSMPFQMMMQRGQPSGGGWESGGYDYNSSGSYDYGTWFDGSSIVSQSADLVSMSGMLGGTPVLGAMDGIAVVGLVGAVAVGIVTTIVSVVLQATLTYMGIVMMLRVVRGQASDFGTVFKGAYSRLLPMVLTNILMQLAIACGMVLCVVPGIILTYGLFFSSQIFIDKNIPYVDALKASWSLTDGHKLSLFIMTFILGLLNFAGLLACGAGVLITASISMVAIAIVYDRLATPGNAYLHSGEGMTSVFE